MKLQQDASRLATKALVAILLSAAFVKAHEDAPSIEAPELIRPDLDYFPSRLHATIFRNWDIVPHERLAATLGTDIAAVRKLGKTLGLKPTPPLTAEEIRRNTEIVLRRNWGLLPRSQIDQLAGMPAREMDEFLGKEIFLRALLAAQPDGLTLLHYTRPDETTDRRVRWFAERLARHLEAVASTPEEPRLAFITELCNAHNSGDFTLGLKVEPGEIDLRRGWKIESVATGQVAQTAVEDFTEYCERVQHAKLEKTGSSKSGSSRTISLAVARSPANSQSYSLTIDPDHIGIVGGSESGIFRGLIELERRMKERGAPFLKPTVETNRPTFIPRYVSSYFSLLTDVLGQDVVNPFPDGYLNELAHQDADGVWVYTLLQDLVPSPVFEELGVGSDTRLRRLRALVNRAAKYGLKVYIYLNEPRAQFFEFFEKHPDVKGRVEGNTAALCTSTEAVQKHLRGSFERLFREVPGLGGVFVITASENLANCYSHTRHTSCPRCAKRSPAEVIAESIRCMAEGAWAGNPGADFIVWDWSWHSVLGEDVPEKIISQLPRGIKLMADFERGSHIERGGVPMNVEEYSISVVGPSPRAKTRSGQAKDHGFDFLAKIQLSTTWECGTVPFIPVPNLLFRKAVSMRNTGVSGTMGTWTIGSYPSPNTEAFALANWDPNLEENAALRRIAARRYGPDAVSDAVRGWTKLSNAFTEEFPYSTSPYAAPLQHGPSLPLYRRDMPPPYGKATLFNCKDDWTHWPPPYSPELMVKLLRHLCDRWEDGLSDLRAAAAKSTAARRHLAERDFGVAWMVDYYYRAYADDLEFYAARDAGDEAGMKRVAQAQINATEEALRRVRADSRLGWEAELQYYRPSDVLERLISLDAILEPPPIVSGLRSSPVSK